jgi:hypothetical protein
MMPSGLLARRAAGSDGAHVITTGTPASLAFLTVVVFTRPAVSPCSWVSLRAFGVVCRIWRGDHPNDSAAIGNVRMVEAFSS